MDLMCSSRPVVRFALLSCCLIEVTSTNQGSWYTNNYIDNNVDKDGFVCSSHRKLLLCGAYLRWRQYLTRGFDPPASR